MAQAKRFLQYEYNLAFSPKNSSPNMVTRAWPYRLHGVSNYCIVRGSSNHLAAWHVHSNSRCFNAVLCQRWHNKQKVAILKSRILVCPHCDNSSGHGHTAGHVARSIIPAARRFSPQLFNLALLHHREPIVLCEALNINRTGHKSIVITTVCTNDTRLGPVYPKNVIAQHLKHGVSGFGPGATPCEKCKLD